MATILGLEKGSSSIGIRTLEVLGDMSPVEKVAWKFDSQLGQETGSRSQA